MRPAGFPTSATVHASTHIVVRVRGEKAQSFLQDTMTQDLADVGPSQGALTCLLDGTAHVLSVTRVLPTEDGVILDGEQAARDALLGWLARVAPLSGCIVEDETDQWLVTFVRGPDAAAALSHDGGLPDTEHGIARAEGAYIVRVKWGIGGYDVLSPREQTVPASTMSEQEWDEWRVVAGLPSFGRDVTNELIVNETPYLARAVAEKGCYPGQETVAKIRNLGRARRAVVVLDVEQTAPRPGTKVFDGAREVGTITSSARRSAIATVRSEAVDSAELRVGEMRAVVRAEPVS